MLTNEDERCEHDARSSAVIAQSSTDIARSSTAVLNAGVRPPDVNNFLTEVSIASVFAIIC